MYQSEQKNLCALGIGTNLGNMQENIENAIKKLQDSFFSIIRVSSFYLTKPINCLPNTPNFTNVALYGYYEGTPCELLETCKCIESEMGRPTKHKKNESRIIDLDILFFGTQIIKSENLIIPHPRMQSRRFVLEPLSEILPDCINPATGLSVRDSLGKLKYIHEETKKNKKL